MGVTMKHMLTPETVITKQYIGLKTPAGGGLLGKALGVTNDVVIKVDHKNCVICTMAKKLGMGGDPHEPTTDPVAVYDRYYRTGDTISKPIPVDYLPERHRGLHYLETEKCIMCFQCARACPVDCIDIEGTRDVTPGLDGAYRGDKVNLTRFTIDYALCIFCDHCTLACPDKQVCIHMGKEFDYTAFDQGHLVKNLLTDLPFSKEDRGTVLKHRAEIDRLEEEKKKEKAAKAAAAAAAAAA
jgi:formate hydrogenlyase subunit 6/NADH:ubiquinone oxidoreductase subunit I